jgi:hypothetical protein
MFKTAILAKFTFLIILLSLLSCDIVKNDKFDNSKGFIRVYENKVFSDAIIPIDIKQTTDGGYIVLAKKRIAESQFYGTYVMFTDNLGTFKSEKSLSTDNVSPVGNLMLVGTNYYFFSMNATSLATKLMMADESGNVSKVGEIGSATYPLAASLDEASGDFILQYYDRENLQTVIAKVNTSGIPGAQETFAIGAGEFDAEQSVINHLAGTGKSLPFFTGKMISGRYFFNGYFNYTLSMIFFDFGSDAKGNLQGNRDQEAISAALNTSDQTFALSRFDNGSNYFMPKEEIKTYNGAISRSSSITGNAMLELATDAKVSIKSLTIKGKNIALYASDTKGRQLVLYAYDVTSGKLIGSKHLGYSNPLEMAGYTTTSDNGLAIACTQYVAGRLPRICIIKLSSADLETIIQ